MVKARIYVLVLAGLLCSIVSADDIRDGFRHEDWDRNYILHIPPSYGETLDSTALVIALHGGGKNADWMVDVSRLNEKSDLEGFLVCYPNGTQSGQEDQNNWNAGPNFSVYANDVSFMDALIDTLAAGYRIDTLRIFVTGLSAGAMMSHRLGCELSDKIAAIAPVAGSIMIPDWNDCQPGRLISIINFHARNDETAPYGGASWIASADSTMRFWANRLECDLGPDTSYNDSGALRQLWSRTDDSCEILFWTTEDGGHSWPGGDLWDPTGKPPTKAISANDEMWGFFLTHPIPEPEEPEPGINEYDPSVVETCLNPVGCKEYTTLRFYLQKGGRVRIELFDAAGCKVLVREAIVESGERTLELDTRDLNSGVYFCRIQTPTFTRTSPLRLIR